MQYSCRIYLKLKNCVINQRPTKRTKSEFHFRELQGTFFFLHNILVAFMPVKEAKELVQADSLVLTVCSFSLYSKNTCANTTGKQ